MGSCQLLGILQAECARTEFPLRKVEILRPRGPIARCCDRSRPGVIEIKIYGSLFKPHSRRDDGNLCQFVAMKSRQSLGEFFEVGGSSRTELVDSAPADVLPLQTLRIELALPFIGVLFLVLRLRLSLHTFLAWPFFISASDLETTGTSSTCAEWPRYSQSGWPHRQSSRLAPSLLAQNSLQ